jgi:hypothetical protein
MRAIQFLCPTAKGNIELEDFSFYKTSSLFEDNDRDDDRMLTSFRALKNPTRPFP